MISQIAQASLTSNILIDFECCVDTDIGLIRLIKDKYQDRRVFNIDKLTDDFKNIILSLINRDNINPLSVISNKDISEEDLYDYYVEFMTEEYDEILKRSVTTELVTLINLLDSETSVNVTILCESEIEEELLKKDKSFNKCNILVHDRDEVYLNKYSTFIFKYITNNVNEFIAPYKNYYFSKCKINFDDNFNPISPGIINKIIYNGGSVEIIDLYNKSYLEGENKNENI